MFYTYFVNELILIRKWTDLLKKYRRNILILHYHHRCMFRWLKNRYLKLKRLKDCEFCTRKIRKNAIFLYTKSMIFYCIQYLIACSSFINSGHSSNVKEYFLFLCFGQIDLNTNKKITGFQGTPSILWLLSIYAYYCLIWFQYFYGPACEIFINIIIIILLNIQHFYASAYICDVFPDTTI